MNRQEDAMSLELDGPTVSLLMHLAEIWGVTEEEAVHRAIGLATAALEPSTEREISVRLEAFKELQRSLDLTSAKAQEWQDAVRDARR
jgi:hypothetical protein